MSNNVIRDDGKNISLGRAFPKMVHVAISPGPTMAVTHLMNRIESYGGFFIMSDIAMAPPPPLSMDQNPQMMKILIFKMPEEKVREITGDGYNAFTIYAADRFLK